MYEGEDPPRATAADEQAIAVWNALADRNGGIQWGGLPFMAELLGVDDLEGLVVRLVTIKLHRPPEQGQPARPPE